MPDEKPVSDGAQSSQGGVTAVPQDPGETGGTVSPDSVSDDDIILCVDDAGEFYDVVRELGLGRGRRRVLAAVIVLVLAAGAAAAAFFALKP